MKTYKCHGCGIEVEWGWHKMNKYCSIKCQGQVTTRERIRQWLEEGKGWTSKNPGWAKKYLLETRGNCCHVCHITEWMDKPIVLELDHIDGDHRNNHPDNLRMICPNCHSQTDTYKAKNKGKGRPNRSYSSNGKTVDL